MDGNFRFRSQISGISRNSSVHGELIVVPSLRRDRATKVLIPIASKMLSSVILRRLHKRHEWQAREE